MKIFILTCGIVLASTLFVAGCTGDPVAPVSPEEFLSTDGSVIPLPQPRNESDISVEEALHTRRSLRTYTGEPLETDELGQLLWAAQGITDPRGYRTAPSAGALYPLEVYVAARNVRDLQAGIYLYLPEGHLLRLVMEGDGTTQLCSAALDQTAVANAPANIVISALPERTTVKYGDRGMRYVYMEAGHAAQNIYLQAVALDLGTVTIGAFHDEEVREVMNMTEHEIPLYIMPVGRSSEG